MLNMKHQFPVEWEVLKSGKTPALSIQEQHYPFLVRDKKPTFEPRDVTLYAKGSVNPLEQGIDGDYFTVTLDSKGINFLKPAEWQWPDDLYLIIPYILV